MVPGTGGGETMATTKPSSVDVAQALRGIDFPASKEDLIAYVHKVRDRYQAVLEVLQHLPEREYENMADVEKAVDDII
jgi:hypothetical protein